MEAGVLEEGTPKHTDITDARIHHILVLEVCAPIVRKQGITEIMESCVYNYMYPYCKLKNIICVWYLLITVGLNDSSIICCYSCSAKIRQLFRVCTRFGSYEKIIGTISRPGMIWRVG